MDPDLGDSIAAALIGLLAGLILAMLIVSLVGGIGDYQSYNERKDQAGLCSVCGDYEVQCIVDNWDERTIIKTCAR